MGTQSIEHRISKTDAAALAAEAALNEVAAKKDLLDKVRGFQRRYLDFYVVQNSSPEQAERVAGVSRDTVAFWRAQDPEFDSIAALHENASKAERVDALNGSKQYGRILARVASGPAESKYLSEQFYGAPVPELPPPVKEKSVSPKNRPLPALPQPAAAPPSISHPEATSQPLPPEPPAAQSAPNPEPSSQPEPSSAPNNVSPDMPLVNEPHFYRTGTKVMSEQEASNIKLLRNKYRSTTGRSDYDAHLRQAIYWTVYESGGHRNKTITNELLEISHPPIAGSMPSALRDMLPDKATNGEWRKLEIYQQPLAVINGWLNQADQAQEGSAAKAEDVVIPVPLQNGHASEPAVPAAVDTHADLFQEQEEARTRLLKEKYQGIHSIGPESAQLKQAIYWTLYETSGQKSMAKTNGILGISKDTIHASLRSLPADIQEKLHEGTQRDEWKSFEVYQKPLAIIDGWLKEAGLEPVIPSSTVKLGDVGASPAPLPNGNVVEPVTPIPFNAELFKEQEEIRTTLLKEKYHSIHGRGPETAQLKQAIFWALYETSGQKNMEKTDNILEISHATIHASLQHLPEEIAAKLKDRLGHGRDEWKSFEVYQKPLATINGWLEEASLEPIGIQPVASVAQNTAAPVEGAVPAHQQLLNGHLKESTPEFADTAAATPQNHPTPAPKPVFNATPNVIPAAPTVESRIIPATAEEIAATWAQRELLTSKTDEQWAKLAQRQAEARSKRTNLLG